jgi:hypothetical protein
MENRPSGLYANAKVSTFQFGLRQPTLRSAVRPAA